MRLRPTPKVVNNTKYWYRCCAQTDVEQVLEPGQTFDLHWLTDTELPLPTPIHRYVTLSAALVGPYLNPFTNVADGNVQTISAPDITADTWEAQTPVSSMALPSDLPSGLYQLRTSTLLDPQTRGVTSSGIGVIRVGRAAPREAHTVLVLGDANKASCPTKRVPT